MAFTGSTLRRREWEDCKPCFTRWDFLGLARNLYLVSEPMDGKLEACMARVEGKQEEKIITIARSR